MKVFNFTCLLCFFLASFLQAQAQSQEYFHYYKGQRQYLQLNTGYLYLVTSPEIASAERLKELLGGEAMVLKFAQDKTAQTLNPVADTPTEPEYWAEVRLDTKREPAEYLLYLEELRKISGIKVTSPYFQNNKENKIGLSHYFYVKLKSRQDLEILMKQVQQTDTRIVGQNKFMPLWYTLKCTEKTSGNALQHANAFFESKLFQYAEPDLMTDDKVHANDPEFTNQWGLNNTGLFGGTAGIDINTLDAWEITKGSREVVVAVLDQGFEMDHPDLQANTFGTGFDSELGTSPALVLGSHGTACAGIIAALQDNNTGVSGVAPNVRLMSVSNSLAGTPASRQKRADGINWAWMNGAAVISNSWGSGVAYAIIDDAITDALANGRGGLGTIVVFSSGNDDGAVGYPANSNADIVTVGAMSQCGERKNPLSCDGENWWGSNYGNELDVVAPGVHISTTDRQGASGYSGTDYTATFNGTSSACPAVAGVAALILSVNPCLTHDQVEDILEQTAQKVGVYTYNLTFGKPNGTWDNEMGYGLVDAEAAVAMAQGMLPLAPNFDLYSKDRPFDIGIEPNPDAGPMWISEDIWVRKNLDGGLIHENPEFKSYSPNGIYVKVTNRGTLTSTCTNLSVYFTKASTGLVWPTHWDDYFQVTAAGNILHGDKINTVLIPALAPGASYTAEIPWYPPNPADFDSDIHHFCLLSRITSPSDPMFDEQNLIGVSQNVRRNNNIAWKNISVYALDADGSFAAMSVFVRGILKGWSSINLRFLDQGFEEQINTRFFERRGTIRLAVDPAFMERIKEARLYNVKILDDQTMLISSPRAQIRNLPIHSKETFSLAVQLQAELRDKEETILDVVQQNAQTGQLEGGERFLIKQKNKQDFFRTPPAAEKTGLTVYPNPVTTEMAVKFSVSSDDSAVEITLQHLLDGKQRITLLSGKRNPGEYQDTFNVGHLPKGIYVLTVKTADETAAQRVILE